MRRTDADTLEHAFTIAGESAPNQSFAGAPTPRDPAAEGSDVKEGIPWSVVTGLVALGLAATGHTGPRNILDSRRHFNFAEDLSLGTSLHVVTPISNFTHAADTFMRRSTLFWISSTVTA